MSIIEGVALSLFNKAKVVCFIKKIKKEESIITGNLRINGNPEKNPSIK